MQPVRVESPEEREYRRYLGEIEERRRRVAEAQSELEALRVELGRFDAEYHARVGRLFVERDQLHLAIQEYEVRIARLQAEPKSDPQDVEREVGERFRQEREHVEEEDQESRRYEEEHRRQQVRPRLAADQEAQLKRMYRDLAKRFHPDLAKTDDERRERERVMQQVNAAFVDRSLDALRDLLSQAEIEDESFAQRSIGDKLVWAIREVSRLDALLASIQAEHQAVQATDSYALWSRQQAGEQVLELLEEDLSREIEPLRDQLATLISTYRGMLEERNS